MRVIWAWTALVHREPAGASAVVVGVYMGIPMETAQTITMRIQTAMAVTSAHPHRRLRLRLGRWQGGHDPPAASAAAAVQQLAAALPAS